MDKKYIWELHAHTSPVSGCSEIPPEECIKSYAELGYAGVVITNHFEPGLFKRFSSAKECADWYLEDFCRAEEAGEKYGMRVLPGMEIRFKENHNDYLVYGVDADFVKIAYSFLDQGIEKFYQAMHSDNRLILQAHPFRDGMERADLNFIDGIEAFNMHPHHNSRVGVASAYALEHDLLITAGTDFHHPGHQGLGGTAFFENPKDNDELVRLLRSRNYQLLVGGRTILPY